LLHLRTFPTAQNLTTADDRKTALLLQCRNRAITAFADAAAAVSTAQILTTADDRKTALLLQCRNRAIAAFADAPPPFRLPKF